MSSPLSIFLEPLVTDWTIAGSSGFDVQAETPIVNLSAGASKLELPLQNVKTREEIKLLMAGVSVGFGIGQSMLGLVDIEVSLPFFPSDGIGNLVRGPKGSESIDRMDFFLNVVFMLTGSAKAGAGASINGLLFVRYPDLVEELKAASFLMNPFDAAHCAGLFYGTHVGTGMSAGVSVTTYLVTSVV